MDGNASNPKVKVVLVGAEGTGKTALARRFCKNEFSETGKDFVEEGAYPASRALVMS